MGLRTWLVLKQKTAATFRAPRSRRKRRSYWEKRQNTVYLQHIRALVNFIGRDARSMIDVGTNGCPYLEWFDWIPRRVSIDLRKPYRSETVKGIAGDFLSFEIIERFDLCTCFQTLEHIRDAQAFAHKLLEAAPRVLISVPYEWPAGTNKHHVHDPVDRAKVASWFGVEPTFSMISYETNGIARLVCYFDEGAAPAGLGVSHQKVTAPRTASLNREFSN